MYLCVFELQFIRNILITDPYCIESVYRSFCLRLFLLTFTTFFFIVRIHAGKQSSTRSMNMIRAHYSTFATRLWLAAMLLFGLAIISPVHAGDDEVWLLVDTKSKVLRVKEGEQTKAEYRNIAIGRRGTTVGKIRGDNKTPLGIYRIGWFNPNSQFHHFYGFNYPSRVDAARGLRSGLIDNRTYQRLFDADVLDRVPDQNTRLGGQVGIHGLGSADPKIHKLFDWTKGCIALTNSQINSLGAWIKNGTVVVIR